MSDGYWKCVPMEYVEKWKYIFSDSKEGPNLSACCPICHKKGLHRYYQKSNIEKPLIASEEYVAKGAEWQWCSFCRTYEHAEVLVPEWWVPDVEVDGNKLTAIPEILEIAYQDEKKVNKWRAVPEAYCKLWNKVFNENRGDVVLKEACPICSRRMLRQYYAFGVSEQMKYKKKPYKGQGAHWEWCASCFHYRFNHLAYVPLEWDCDLNIEAWRLMVIPEPINERMYSDGKPDANFSKKVQN